jgi:hypothetical protein
VRESIAKRVLRLSDVCISMGYFFVGLSFRINPEMRASAHEDILDDNRPLKPEEGARLHG